MPTFLGTLELGEQQNGTIEEQGAALIAKHSIPEVAEVVVPAIVEHGAALIAKHSIPEVVIPTKAGKRITTDTAVVLLNAAHGFVHPNILDVKLGVRLWADDASQEKKTRFDVVTAETTHKDLGFRIAGMRVWQGEGAKGPDIDEEGFKVYDKNYGRYSINTTNVTEAFRNFIFAESAGIDEELGRLVAQAFYTDVSRIQELLEGHESRMFSASLLFVFEGDGKALRYAMEEASKPPPATNGNGWLSEEDKYDDDDDDNEDEDTAPKIYSVKVIDFAHAEWVPGMGPDENSLIGVRSVAKILKDLGAA